MNAGLNVSMRDVSEDGALQEPQRTEDGCAHRPVLRPSILGEQMGGGAIAKRRTDECAGVHVSAVGDVEKHPIANSSFEPSTTKAHVTGSNDTGSAMHMEMMAFMQQMSTMQRHFMHDQTSRMGQLEQRVASMLTPATPVPHELPAPKTQSNISSAATTTASPWLASDAQRTTLITQMAAANSSNANTSSYTGSVQPDTLGATSTTFLQTAWNYSPAMTYDPPQAPLMIPLMSASTGSPIAVPTPAPIATPINAPISAPMPAPMSAPIAASMSAPIAAPPAVPMVPPHMPPPSSVYQLPHQHQRAPFGQMPGAYLHRPADLPEFHGHADEWPVFVAAFRQSCQAYPFTPLDNLFRLQKCLKGVARQSVQYLLTEPGSVDVILEDLEFRFGRPEMLIQNQIKLLRDFKPLDDRQIDRLVEFSSVVQNIVAYLNKDASRHVLGETVMMTELESKLPPSRQLEWGTHVLALAHRPTALDFCAWLKLRARCVTMLTPSLTSSSTVTSSQQSRNHQSFSQPTGQSRSRQDRHVFNVDRPAPSCGVCHGTHMATDCEKLQRLSESERWAEVRRLGLCFRCLRGGHQSRECRSGKRCSINGCGRMHHTVLHNDAMQTSAEPQNDLAETATEEGADSSVANARRNPFERRSSTTTGSVHSCRQVNDLPLLFRIIPVTVYGPRGSVDTHALLDEGSSLTLIEDDLADELGAIGPVADMTMQFVGNQSSTVSSQEISISISSPEQNAQRFRMDRVHTTRALNLPVQTVNMHDLDSRFQHLRGLPIHPYENAVPKLLIGLEHAELGLPSDVRSDTTGGPMACKTKLGWVIFGGQQRRRIEHVSHLFFCHDATARLEQLEQLVKSYYSTENFGVKLPQRIIESDEDARARAILQTTTKRIGNRFQTGLLWRKDIVAFPNSHAMAQRRLSSVIRKMSRDAEYERLYREQINGYVQKGYARKLSSAEAGNRDHRTWYLPHFGVQTIHKPGKMRLVFDAAATVMGTSLNTELLKGPDLNEHMTNILFRFRMRQVGVCGDVAEMFHQVVIQPEDRCSQRFLWIGDDARKAPEEFEMNVMTFGAKCSPTSAQYVKNRNADDNASEFPEAARAIKTSHYVDDYVASFATEEDAIRVTKDVIEIHRRGGFQLRKLDSSSRSVLAALNRGTAASGGTIDMQLDATESNKILGMRWLTAEDAFYFDVRFPNLDAELLAGARTPTKRELLSAVMSVYDPFGFLGEFLLPTKLMLQELWRSRIGWDDFVPKKIDHLWNEWRSEIPATGRLRIPRCYSAHLLTSKDVQLHVYADASEVAFSAVAYYRVGHAGGHHVAFVAGKTRCAPLKPLSIPRLELQAAVLAVRLMQKINESHDFTVGRTVLWSDSQTVLQWIRSDQRRYKPFVAHRVAEIVDAVGTSCWRWVPTRHNVADDGTRPRTSPKFDENCRWLRGPDFLRDDEDCWPTEPVAVADCAEEEIRTHFTCMVTTRAAVTPDETIDVTRFTNFNRLCRTMAFVMRFGRNQQQRGELNAVEIHAATLKLCRLAQMDSFPAEYQMLEKKQKIGRSSSIVALMPYMDDKGVMRLYGRTDLADVHHLPEEAKRPILLPQNHPFTKLMVRDQHVRMKHQFEEATICGVRQRFWVPNLRSLVRKIRNECMLCRLRAAQPKPQIEGQLPADRLTPNVYPFTYTGLDYFGPISVTIGRRREKRWIALFTCLTVRAIHMEIAQDLSSDACILCIRNFCNTRGIPARIRSDCGTNFVGADGELRKLDDFLDVDHIGRELATKNIEWKFNCPGNPEAGGAWERMVQCAKRVLRVTLKEAAPQIETLRSLVIEAANIINSRPLTHIPVTPEEPAPLTPNHFLLGRMNSTTVPVTTDNKQLCSRKQWRVLQQMTTHFWRRWVVEYLPELTRRTRHYETVGLIEVGSLVLIVDANEARGQWVRGRVESLVYGADGLARTALIKTASGHTRRPITKLAILDVEVGDSRDARSHGARDVANS